jgi:hypothetical protein
MRFVLFFVTTVGALMTIAALVQGDNASLACVGPVTAIAGVFFWRNLRDPEETRKNGLRAQVTFFHQAGAGVTGPGTYARVWTHRGVWHVALDRMSVRGDLQMHGVAQRGWVWLDPAGLPARVKINYAKAWKTWTVSSAAPADEIKEG